jgi:hypothetical protein
MFKWINSNIYMCIIQNARLMLAVSATGLASTANLATSLATGSATMISHFD